MILCLSIAGMTLGVLLIRPYLHAKDVLLIGVDKVYSTMLLRVIFAFTVILLILAGLCWVSVWFGYLGVLALQLIQVIVRQYGNSPDRLLAKAVAMDAQNV